jgi:aminopeptidase N
LAFGFGVQPKYEGPDEVELSLLEPAVVPDPVDGFFSLCINI